VNNNSVLVFDRSDSLIVSNIISGGGSLTQAGTGTLILVASNIYTGKTIISSGTLQIGNGGTSGMLGNTSISNDSALVFDRSDNLSVVSNSISGVGSLTQAGTGTLTLSNVNTYSGGTWVSNGGTLAVRNSQALGIGDLNLIDGTLKMSTGLVINIGGNYLQARTAAWRWRLAARTCLARSTSPERQVSTARCTSSGSAVICRRTTISSHFSSPAMAYQEHLPRLPTTSLTARC